jgi:cell fate (sporulation/competence/biofilm development) regulator YlbF (YheA/YmcA/DUF963 family)
MATTMEQIIELARQLGAMLTENERVSDFQSASRIVAEDEAAQKLLKDFQEQSDKIRQFEQEVKPIEVDDKRRLADLEREVASNGPIKALLRAQTDYLELMHKVNEAIGTHLVDKDGT